MRPHRSVRRVGRIAAVLGLGGLCVACARRTDTSDRDATPRDAAVEAAIDAPREGGPDALELDAMPDAPDAAVDAERPDISRADRSDTPSDAPSDAPTDAPNDARTDAPADAPPCACLAPNVSCSGLCVDPQRDDANCGACGVRCASDQYCAGGRCAAAQTGPGVTCDGEVVDTNTDTRHCGRCGRACCVGSTCSLGFCVHGCGLARTVCTSRCGTTCSAVCADTQSDDQNCGSCGNVCGDVPNSFGGLCSVGQCRPICIVGHANCDAVYDNGCEVDVLTDRAHCGRCDVACGAGQSCVGGRCE